MENIIKLANQYKYSSLQYIDSEDVTNGKIHINSAESIFIYQKSDILKEQYWTSKSKDNIQLFWASNSKTDFFNGLSNTVDFIKQNESKAEKIYVEFIPEDFLDEMTSAGFTIVSEWVDFWNNDLCTLKVDSKKTIHIRPLRDTEISFASQVTKNCFGYSRGFTGESEEVISDWTKAENSCLFAAELDHTIVGLCYVLLYGFDSEKGTVLWIRELAVDPKYQSKGIGRELLTNAINWGKEQGAKRSFLACDSENFNAIKLYESFHYSRRNERGQINMEITL